MRLGRQMHGAAVHPAMLNRGTLEEVLTMFLHHVLELHVHSICEGCAPRAGSIARVLLRVGLLWSAGVGKKC